MSIADIYQREIRSLSDLEESLKKELAEVRERKKSYEKRLQDVLEGDQGDMFDSSGDCVYKSDDSGLKVQFGYKEVSE